MKLLYIRGFTFLCLFVCLFFCSGFVFGTISGHQTMEQIHCGRRCEADGICARFNGAFDTFSGRAACGNNRNFRIFCPNFRNFLLKPPQNFPGLCQVPPISIQTLTSSHKLSQIAELSAMLLLEKSLIGFFKFLVFSGRVFSPISFESASHTNPVKHRNCSVYAVARYVYGNPFHIRPLRFPAH